MGTLKHHAGGSFGDIVPNATAGGDASKANGSGVVAPSLAPAVMLCVAVASMGAFAFGYHLGVVNGPLEVMSQQLGSGGDAFLQGLVSCMRQPKEIIAALASLHLLPLCSVACRLSAHACWAQLSAAC
jgi:hypothetical protein